MSSSLLNKRWKKILAASTVSLVLLGGLGLLAGCALNTPISNEGAKRISHSPHQHDGEFHNIEPKAKFEFNMSVFMDTLFGASKRTPKDEIPVVEISPDRWQKQPSQKLQVAWLGNASSLVEMDGKRILIDPVLSERASPFSFTGPKRFHPSPIDLKTLSNVDAVIISHNHYDHLDEATIRHLANSDTLFYIPLGLKDQFLAWGVKEASIVDLDWWGESKLGSMKIIMTPARHYSNRGVTDFGKTLWASWTILGSQKIFFSGDTGYSKEFVKIGKRFGPFDLTMIKIGAYGPGQSWHDVHMTPEESVQVHKDVKGRTMLPVAWGTFDLALHAWDEPIVRSVEAADKAGIKLITPKLGEIIMPDQYHKKDQWWAKLK